MNDDSEATLKRIRELADRAVELRARWLLEKGTMKALKEAADVVEAELRDLCRSHETSEEVRNRPLIKACEERYLLCAACGCKYDRTLNAACPECAVVADHLAAVERDADGEYSEADAKEGELWDAEDAIDPSHNTLADGEDGGIVDAIGRMREAGGRAWDDVADPEAYLAGDDPVACELPREVDNTDGTTPPWPNGEHGLTPELVEQAGAAFDEMFGDPTEAPKPKRRRKGAGGG